MSTPPTPTTRNAAPAPPYTTAELPPPVRANSGGAGGVTVGVPVDGGAGTSTAGATVDTGGRGTPVCGAVGLGVSTGGCAVGGTDGVPVGGALGDTLELGVVAYAAPTPVVSTTQADTRTVAAPTRARRPSAAPRRMGKDKSGLLTGSVPRKRGTGIQTCDSLPGSLETAEIFVGIPRRCPSRPATQRLGNGSWG